MTSGDIYPGGLTECQHQAREAIIHAAAIRAALCAARGLPPSSGCRVCGAMSDRLREVLAYEPDTGNLRWRVDRGRSAKAGQLAGSVHSCGYIHLMVDGRRIYAHRAIWLMVTGLCLPDLIDHIDGVKTNNRLANLRPATKSINALNMRDATAKNTSGLLGVSRDGSRFVAALKVNGKRMRIGGFSTPQLAHEAYLKMKRQCVPGIAEPVECDSEGGEAD